MCSVSRCHSSSEEASSAAMRWASTTRLLDCPLARPRQACSSLS
ncbi:hypothetical protein ACI51X_06140 [Pectobacterium versatile]|nr:hypothetical protein [Pseudomonas carnis]RYY89727.1 MAG: hypothetical protein EOO15_05375 [Chitinophagaceae bacterium]